MDNYGLKQISRIGSLSSKGKIEIQK